MTYQLIDLKESSISQSEYFVEGLVLASNFATQPLSPESWLTSLFGEDTSKEIDTAVVSQINNQYTLLKSSTYNISQIVDISGQPEHLAQLSEGFMTLWPLIEQQWQQEQMNDGTLRMMQALLTTFMLALDEEKTREQMKQVGYEEPPQLKDLLPQLDLMVNEVAMAADEVMTGNKAQQVNPYKDVGRNDLCVCGSGNKFKQCCGK
ncbi:YecA family protein [Vibrio sp. S4M6]|uniref:YecA family protein n=1 Tax=Vibrio sinus TaxID=2946865 RepID=UPI00202A38B0|nr:YecA family protein [Vibrio sinus]MCL9783026.1 YecA family protein [Vibrio sinus]